MYCCRTNSTCDLFCVCCHVCVVYVECLFYGCLYLYGHSLYTTKHRMLWSSVIPSANQAGVSDLRMCMCMCVCMMFSCHLDVVYLCVCTHVGREHDWSVLILLRRCIM